MSTTILCDVDDVLFDTTKACIRRLREDIGHEVGFDEFTLGWKRTMDPEAYRHLDQVIFPDPSLYDDVGRIPGSLEGVESLRRAGMQVLFVTAGPPEAFPGKASALRRFGFIDPADSFCRDLLGVSRKEYVRGDALIDDDPKNILTTTARLPIVFTRPWNEGMEWTPRLKRACEWSEVVEHINRMFRQRRAMSR